MLEYKILIKFFYVKSMLMLCKVTPSKLRCWCSVCWSLYRNPIFNTVFILLE